MPARPGKLQCSPSEAAAVQTFLSGGHGTIFMCPALWCKIGSGDRPLPSFLPTTFLDALSAQEHAPVSLSVHWNLGASDQRLSLATKKALLSPWGPPGKGGCGGEPSLFSTDKRISTQTPAREMGLCMQLHQPPSTFPGSKEKSCPCGGPGLEGPKKPCPCVLWKPEQSLIPNGTIPFFC